MTPVVTGAAGDGGSGWGRCLCLLTRATVGGGVGQDMSLAG